MYKSKKLLTALLFIMVTCLSLAFAACAPKTVTVTLYDGQEVVLQEEVKVGDSFVLPDRSKDGFEFLGWGETENSSSPSKGTIKPQYDVTLYAIWQEKEQTFTVTFVDYDGTTIVQREVVKGQAATPPENPTRKGYTFVGWDTDFSNVQGRLRVTAQYEVNSYKVTFMSLGQKVEGDDVVSEADFGTAITPPQLNVAGLVFKGWYTDENYAEGSLVDFGTFVMPDSEVVFYAKWAAKEDIGLSIQNSATNVVYGDTFVLTALHDQKDGIAYTYRWFKDGVEINGENEKTLQVVARDVDKHTYGVEVSVSKEGAASSVANSSVELTAQKRTLDVTVSNGSVVYGDEKPNFDFNLGNAASFDDIDELKQLIQIICDYEKGDDVGNYQIDAGPFELTNYTLNVTKGNLEVTQKEITLYVNGSKDFDNKVWSGEIVADGVISLDTFEGTASTKKVFGELPFTSADDFDIDFTITRDGADKCKNYDVSFEYNVVINAIDLNVEIGEAFDGDYDGQNHLPEVTVGKTLTDNEVKILFNGETIDKIVNQGTYNLCVSVTALGYNDFSREVTVEIAKREIIVSADEEMTYSYGQVWSKSDWSEGVKNLVGGHSFEGTLATTNFQNGVYTANGSELGDSFEWLTDWTIMSGGVDVSKNYTLTYALNVKIIKEINAEATDTTVTYDGKAHRPDIVVNDLDSYTIKYSSDGESYSAKVPAFTNAGTYKVYYVISADNCYDKRDSVTITINKKDLTITADDKTVTYGDAIPEFTYTQRGLVDSDSEKLAAGVSFNCAYKAGSFVGSYDINAVYTDGNYEVTVNKGTLTVKQKEITLTIEGSKTFDNTVWSGEIVADGVISMDTFAGTASTKKEFDKNAFTAEDDFDIDFTITRDGADKHENYDVTFVCNVKINEAELSVTVGEGFNGIYDGQNHLPEVKVDETLTQNTVTILVNGMPSSQVTDAGTHNITISVTAFGYNDFSQELTVTIEKREIAVVVDEEMTYSFGKIWSKSDWSEGVTNLVGGHSFEGTLVTSGYENRVYTSSGSEPGSDFDWQSDYKITESGIDVSENYTLTYALTVKIIKEINAEATGTTVTYDGKAHSPDIVVNDLDSYTVKYSSDGESYSAEVPAFTNAGTYKVYYVISADNCYDKSGSVTITINKKDLTLTADNKAVSYGDAIPEFTYTQSGLVDADSEKLAAGVSFNCAYKAGSFVGSYDVKIKYTDGNYNITLNKGKLTVSEKKLVLNVEDGKSFDNTAFVKQYSVTDGVLSGDTVNATVTTNGKSGTFGKDDVSFEFTAMRGGQNVKKNYTLTLGEVNIEIQNISMEVTVDGFDGVYDGQNHLPKVNGETLTEKTVVYKVRGEVVTEIKNAGVYQVEVTVSAEGYDDYTSSVNVQITQKQLSVSVDYTKNYKENEPWSNSVWDSYAKGLIAGDQLQGTLKTNGYQNKVYEASGSPLGSDFVWEGGSYKIMSGENDVTANYALTYDLRVEIGKLIEVEAFDSTISYDGNAHAANIKVVSPEDAVITYKVDGGEETGVLPSFTEVGTYKVSYTVSAEGFFEKTGEVTVTIQKATLNITIDDVVKTYGQNFDISEVVPLVEGLADGDQLDFAITSDWKQQVGSYTITLDGGETEHYVWSDVTAKITVNKAALTIDVTSGEITYGDVLPQLDFKVSGAVNGDDEKINSAVKPSCDYVQGMNVGSYDINAVYTDGNYNITLNKGTLTVKEKEITLTIEGSKTFDNTVWSGEIVADGVISMDTFAGTASTKHTFAKNAFTNESDFDIDFTITRDGANKRENYDVTFVCNVKINEAELSVTVGEGFNGTYDGQNHLPEVKVDETLTQNTVTILDDGIPLTQVTDAGTYNITISVTAFGYNDFSQELTVTIEKREIAVVVDEEMTYSFGKIWSKSDWSEGVRNLVGGHSFEGTLVTSGYENRVYTSSGSEPGSDFGWQSGYKITESGIDVSENYTLTYALTVKIIKEINAEVTDTTVTYDGKAHSPDIVVNDLDSYTIKYSSDGKSYFAEVPAFTNAGTYEVYYVISADNCYDKRGSVTITINQKDLTITADDKTVTYGDAIPEFTYTQSGLVDSDSEKLAAGVSFNCAYKAGSFVGSYDVKIKYTDGNYNITLNKGTLTVKQKEITLTIEGNKTFDNKVWSGEIVADGVISMDTFAGTASTKHTFAKNAFTSADDFDIDFTITRDGANKHENYAVTFVCNVKINEAELSVTVGEGFNGIYDGQNHLPEVTVDETLTQNTVTILVNGMPSSQVTDAGTYNITISVTALGYNDFSQELTVTIEKREIVLRVEETKDYEFEEEWEKSQWGEEVTNIVEGHTFEGTLATTNFQNGVYTANGELGDSFEWLTNWSVMSGGVDVSKNYTVSYDIKVQIIKNMSVEANDTIDTFDGNAHTPDVTVTDPADGADLQFSTDGVVYSSEVPSFTNAGTYTVHYKATAANYKEARGSVTITIGQKDLTITADDKTVTYGAAKPELTYNAEGFVENETQKNIVLSCDYEQGSNVGSYPIAVSYANDNYKVSLVNGTLTVNKKVVKLKVEDKKEFDNTVWSNTYSIPAEDLFAGDSLTVTVKTNGTIGSYTDGTNLIVTVDGKRGETDVTANYDVQLGKVDVVIENIDMNLTVKNVTAQYDGQDHSPVVVGDTLTEKTVTFKVRGVVQTSFVNAGEYTVEVTVSAKGYNDFVKTVFVSIAKAKVNIQEEIRKDVTEVTSAEQAKTIVPQIVRADNETPVSGLNFTFDNSVIVPNVGDTYVITATLGENQNYASDNPSVDVTVKITSVQWNGKNYTIEEALYWADSGQIVVKANTNFTTAAGVYGDTGHYTLKREVKLLLPYTNEDESICNETWFEINHGDFNGRPTVAETGNDVTLNLPHLPQNKILNIYGEMLVSSKRGAGTPIGGGIIDTNYAVFNLEEGSTVNVYGTYYSMGFTTGQGKIFAKNSPDGTQHGKIYDAFTITGFKGGTISLQIKDAVFPVNQYTISNIEVYTEIEYGCEMYAVAMGGASKTAVFATIKVISSSANDAMLSVTSGNVSKDFDESNGKTIISVKQGNGGEQANVSFNNISMNVGTSLSTDNLNIPFPGNFKFVFENGNININGIGIKLLPGAEVEVKKDAIVNLTGGSRFFVYGANSGFVDSGLGYGYPYSTYNQVFRNKSIYSNMGFDANTPAKVTVEGKINVDNSSVGGNILAVDGGEIVFSNAKTVVESVKVTDLWLIKLCSLERDISDATGSISLTIAEDKSPSGGAEFFTSSAICTGKINGVDGKAFENNATYTASGDSWVKS